MIDTRTLSRRIVAALDPDGTRWPEWVCCCGATESSGSRCMRSVPDLAQPQNLHLLLEVADSLFCEAIQLWGTHNKHVARAQVDRETFANAGYGPTRSLAILAAVCAALGIDTAQETTHA